MSDPITRPEDSTQVQVSRIDPPCATITNADIDRGAICAWRSDPNAPGTEREYFIPTESYTGNIPTWGDVKAALDLLRRDYGPNATGRYVRFNASWYMYLGAAKMWQAQNGDYESIGLPDGFTPPRFAVQEPPPAPRPNYLIDPDTQEYIPLDANPDGTKPITSSGQTLNQVLYGSNAPGAPLGAGAAASTVPDDQLAVPPSDLASAQVNVQTAVAPAAGGTTPAAVPATAVVQPEAASLASVPMWAWIGIGVAGLLALRKRS